MPSEPEETPISRLRALFETELTLNPSLYHPIDISRMRTQDWQVQRYLDARDQDEPSAFTLLLEALRWKQSYGVHDRSDAYFPRELWSLNQTEQFGTDAQGRLIGWGVIRQTRLLKEFSPLFLQFAAHITERADRLNGENGCIYVAKFEASFFHREASMESFQKTLFDYYPGLFKGMYLLNINWIIVAILRLMLRLFDDKMTAIMHMIREEELREFIGEETIPVWLGGKREKVVYPEGLKSLGERAKELGYERKDVEAFYKFYKLEEQKSEESEE